MKIQYQCPSCKQSLAVDDQHALNQVRCPQCSEISQVPAQSEIDPPPQPVVSHPAVSQPDVPQPNVSQPVVSQPTVAASDDANPYRKTPGITMPPVASDGAVQSYVIRAVICTILCQPLGVVAPVFAVLSSTNVACEEYEQARQNAAIARRWCNYALWLGLLYIGFLGTCFLVGFFG